MTMDELLEKSEAPNSEFSRIFDYWPDESKRKCRIRDIDNQKIRAFIKLSGAFIQHLKTRRSASRIQ